MQRAADLVLEGGGNRALALIGAVSVFDEQGYTFQRIAGTSAGAVVGALLASGYTTQRILEMLLDLNEEIFFQNSLVVNDVEDVSEMLSQGVQTGHALKVWLHERLVEMGVETFGDLRLDDPGSGNSANRSFRLVVQATDLNRGCLVRLPWDSDAYGHSPESIPVADAAMASYAMPFFHRPVTLTNPNDGLESAFVGGGYLSDFPIGIFDRADGLPPRWPTFGVKLFLRADALGHVLVTPDHPQFLARLVADMNERLSFTDPWVFKRTVFVDTRDIHPTDVGLGKAGKESLYEAGRASALAFLSAFDFAEVIKRDEFEALLSQPDPGQEEMRVRAIFRGINPSLDLLSED